MAGNHTFTTEVVKGESKTVTWNLINWVENHDVIAMSSTGCLVEIGNPKVVLRFFLQPFEKSCPIQHSEAVSKWYSLCAEVLRSRPKIVIKVNAEEASVGGYLADEGTIVPTKSNGKFMTIIEEFIHVHTMHRDKTGIRQNAAQPPRQLMAMLQQRSVKDLKLSLDITMFHFNEISMGEDATANLGAGAVVSEEDAEAESSLIEQLKTMYIAADNFSDLKLETKDNVTLSAHRFLLAARSPYFRKLIEDAAKKQNFGGTIQMQDVNGKPLMTILHWMYTGELHENAGRVMEEVVEASTKFELTHLLKVLDKKLITICNKENMFRLYQVSQKNAMPTAMDDISTYIRENL